MLKLTRRAAAFSMLELVVVTGVVVVAAAVLIPGIAKVRDSAGDVTCQGNLRQLYSALEMYNVDHNGSMPYGIYYEGSGPPTWGPVPGNDNYVSWASELNKYFNPLGGYAPAFQCPQAQKQAGPHPVSYVMNMIVAVSPYYEIAIGGTPPNAQTKPPSLHLMMRTAPGTALIWDTPIRPNPFFEEGYLVGADIDDQRFWRGAVTPQFRYFSPHDPWGQVPPGVFGNNRMVFLSVGSQQYQNIDPPATVAWPYQGNLRFRHNGQTQCNVAFSDGSVRQFTAVVGTNNTVTSPDALRRYFMIQWPPGVTPNSGVPTRQGPMSADAPRPRPHPKQSFGPPDPH